MTQSSLDDRDETIVPFGIGSNRCITVSLACTAGDEIEERHRRCETRARARARSRRWEMMEKEEEEVVEEKVKER